MNRKLKSLLAMVCVLALTLAMSVCAFAADTVTEDEAANYKSAAETLISQIAGFSDEEIESKIDAMADDAMKSGNIAVNPRASQKRDIVKLYHKAI